MIRYKGNILEMLKEKGYSTYRLWKEKIFGERTIQDFRNKEKHPYQTLDTLCKILKCGIDDILEFIPDEE